MRLAIMLKKAHAGEIAAYHAYEGHWRSVKCELQREAIKKIQKDELEHRIVVAKLLDYIGYKPSFWRDTTFEVLGRTLSFLCFYTGWFLPMKRALLIEKIGTVNYYEMVQLCIVEGYPQLGLTFMALADKEREHQEYFEKLLNENG